MIKLNDDQFTSKQKQNDLWLILHVSSTNTFHQRNTSFCDIVLSVCHCKYEKGDITLQQQKYSLILAVLVVRVIMAVCRSYTPL